MRGMALLILCRSNEEVHMHQFDHPVNLLLLVWYHSNGNRHDSLHKTVWGDIPFAANPDVATFITGEQGRAHSRRVCKAISATRAAYARSDLHVYT